MSKIWYGKVTNNDGYVYKRFVSVTTKGAKQLLETIRQRKGGYSISNKSNGETYLKSAIKREGNYLFLNFTQAEYIGVAKEGYNTAIFIKE